MILWIVTQVGSFAREDTNSPNVAKVVTAARNLFAASRADVGKTIEEKLRGKTIAVSDLDAVLVVLDGESNKLRKAASIGKLDIAARQVEAVSIQSAAILKDPGNKGMAEGLELQRWLDEIARQKSIGEILEGDIARMRSTVQELRSWALVIEPVAPPDQVATRLKSRLGELLNEWRNSKPATGQDSQKIQTQIAKTVPRANADPIPSSGGNPAFGQPTVSAGQVYAVTDFSPAVASVLRLAEQRMDEAKILNAIDTSEATFALTAEQIIAIQEKVCSHIISAMIRRDAERRTVNTWRGR